MLHSKGGWRQLPSPLKLRSDPLADFINPSNQSRPESTDAT